MASKWHRRPPFRAEHLGSLLRPVQLLEARAAVDKKQATRGELSSVEDEYIKQIVADPN
jgi:methionine synthase II (cobalamin-independent)